MKNNKTLQIISQLWFIPRHLQRCYDLREEIRH